jgi:broad specificity polyphosphatase/5'/3'-nucleotidase SurE
LVKEEGGPFKKGAADNVEKPTEEAQMLGINIPNAGASAAQVFAAQVRTEKQTHEATIRMMQEQMAQMQLQMQQQQHEFNNAQQANLAAQQQAHIAQQQVQQAHHVAQQAQRQAQQQAEQLHHATAPNIIPTTMRSAGPPGADQA